MSDRVGRLWRDLPRPTRRALRGAMRSLLARYGSLDDRMMWECAKLVCEAGLAAQATSGEATHEVAKRQHGTGRRPARKDVSRALKRAGLQASTYERLLVRLEALAKRPGGSLMSLRDSAGGRG